MLFSQYLLVKPVLLASSIHKIINETLPKRTKIKYLKPSRHLYTSVPLPGLSKPSNSSCLADLAFCQPSPASLSPSPMRPHSTTPPREASHHDTSLWGLTPRHLPLRPHSTTPPREAARGLLLRWRPGGASGEGGDGGPRGLGTARRGGGIVAGDTFVLGLICPLPPPSPSAYVIFVLSKYILYSSEQLKISYG